MRNPVELNSELGDTLSRAARGFGVPGLAIALAAPGRKALWTDGLIDLATARPVRRSSWFSVASLGKHVTAAAVLHLAQRGELDLSAPVGHYLNDLPAAWAGRSVLSLLHHTSGLPEYLAHQPADPVPDDRRSFMARYGQLVPAFDEGDAWIYTNTNYILAGMLVAQLQGQPYTQAVQSMLDRAGCPGAMVGSPAWARSTNAGDPHSVARDEASARREVIGDGDACFTPDGALRWLEVLLDDQLLDAEHSRILFSPGLLTSGRPSAYGCGWFLEPLGEGTLAHHAGHFDGWTAIAILNRSRGSGVMAMCNLAPGHTRAIRHLAQRALEHFAPGSTALSLPVLDDDEPQLSARLRAQLLRASGAAADNAALAEELQRVAAHGSAVRTVPNLHAGMPPDRFDLVYRQAHGTHRWLRYRIGYADRTEHALVGLTPEDHLFWAWCL